ncbi:MAG: hypothetical protein BroJett018_13940 [Chloroflexota bacterium]|nr:hypothetical protein [Chloroflexota bacterium]NOG62943.1 hypothetical protein [Chloroflexota bacterium]GIK63600.1 MAG: hypothetical protein BroJett018_13940 [Chloroflexota bacterium]
MDDIQLETSKQFLEYINALNEEIEAKGSSPRLDAYLSSLYALIQPYRESKPVWNLFAQLLSRAFSHESLPFNPDWLQYTTYPEPTLPEFEQVEKMILFQIADFHRMGESGLLDLSPGRLWMGVNSPTGHRWYNFHPTSYLECAARGSSQMETTCTWGFFQHFLLMGQVYE